jgi:hypothetical protein
MKILFGKDGKPVITLLQKQHTTLASALQIAQTIGGQAHDAAPAAKKVVEGLVELARLLPAEGKVTT